MSSRLKEVYSKGLIHPPKWLPANLHYEVITGSVSYGVSEDTSDMDIVGFCIPEKNMIFPHLSGEIMDFGTQKQRFGVWQEHHIVDVDKNQEYDFSVYSIVKFFNLLMENNPNMCDIIFTPQRCVLFATKIAQHVRDNRKMFLHKGSSIKFSKYAFSQLKKLEGGANRSNPKRKETVEKYGMDLKFAYHVVRLLLQCEQILVEHDLDIERNSEILKSIRRGEWDIGMIKDWFTTKERAMQELYVSSSLQHSPNEEAIKRLLIECLEMHYGSLSNAVVMKNESDNLATDMFVLLNKHGYYN